MMRQRQLPSQISSTEPASALTSLPSWITALYAKNNQAIKEQSSLVICHVPHIFVPIAVTSTLWIIPSYPQTPGSDDNNLP